MRMVAGMNIAQQAGRLLDHKTRDKEHGLIKCAVAKGCSMCGFVNHTGRKDPDSAIKQERRNTP